MFFARKLFSSLCVVAVVLAALTPVSASLFWALLLPVLFIVGATALVWTERHSEASRVPVSSLSFVDASRAPPLLTR
jgi:hypothetical protein